VPIELEIAKNELRLLLNQYLAEKATKDSFLNLFRHIGTHRALQLLRAIPTTSTVEDLLLLLVRQLSSEGFETSVTLKDRLTTQLCLTLGIRRETFDNLLIILQQFNLPTVTEISYRDDLPIAKRMRLDIALAIHERNCFKRLLSWMIRNHTSITEANLTAITLTLTERLRPLSASSLPVSTLDSRYLTVALPDESIMLGISQTIRFI